MGPNEAALVERIVRIMTRRQQLMNVGLANPKVAQAIVAVQLPLMNGTGDGGSAAWPELADLDVEVGGRRGLRQGPGEGSGKNIHDSKSQNIPPPGKGVRAMLIEEVIKAVFEEVFFDWTRKGSFLNIGAVQGFCNGIFGHFWPFQANSPSV